MSQGSRPGPFSLSGFPNAIVGDPNGRPVMISPTVMAYSDAAGVARTVTLQQLPVIDGTFGLDSNTLLPNNGAHVNSGGWVDVTKDNTLIDGYDFTSPSFAFGLGVANVVTNNLTISRCWFHNIDGQDSWACWCHFFAGPFSGLTMSDCLVNGTSSSVTGPNGILKMDSTVTNVKVLRCRAYNTSSFFQFAPVQGPGTLPYGNVVADCYCQVISDPSAFALHLEIMNVSCGTGGLLVSHNHFTGPTGQTATLYCTTDCGDEGNITIDNNLLDGFPQNTVYSWGGGVSGVLIAAAQNWKFTNNKVDNRGGQTFSMAGPNPPDTRILASGNVYYPGMTPIPGF